MYIALGALLLIMQTLTDLELGSVFLFQLPEYCDHRDAPLGLTLG